MIGRVDLFKHVITDGLTWIKNTAMLDTMHRVSQETKGKKHLNIFQRNDIKECSKAKKKSLPRGIEPRSPARISFNDKRKS